jgi:hypothetical protein
MPVCVGDEAWNGQLPWASLPSSSVSVFQERRDDQADLHHGKADDRLGGSFAVKPRAFGTPLGGLGA